MESLILDENMEVILQENIYRKKEKVTVTGLTFRNSKLDILPVSSQLRDKYFNSLSA